MTISFVVARLKSVRPRRPGYVSIELHLSDAGCNSFAGPASGGPNERARRRIVGSAPGSCSQRGKERAGTWL